MNLSLKPSFDFQPYYQSMDRCSQERFPLTICSLSLPGTLLGGDCVFIHKFLARRKCFLDDTGSHFGNCRFQICNKGWSYMNVNGASKWKLRFLCHMPILRDTGQWVSGLH